MIKHLCVLSIVTSLFLPSHSTNSLAFQSFGLASAVGKATEISRSIAQIGPSKSLALPLFHALTGCDTTSQLLGCGKKTACTSWNSTPALTYIMMTLTEAPESFTMEYVHMQCIERFVVLMYSKTCGSATVNDTRHHLFSNGIRSLDCIPPTQAALFEHVKRSLLQASFIRKQSVTPHQEIPVFDK